MDIHGWLKESREACQRDEDNVILFTGVERSGKSTLAIQVLPLLDPTFTVERIAFDIDSFFPIVARTPKRGAVLLDEAKVNARHGMSRATKRLLDYLQVCGGLNHHIGLCYPRARRLDDAVAERCRWNLHVVRRGLAQVRTYTGNEDDPWKVRFTFDFQKAPDVIDAPYRLRKDDAARASLMEQALEALPEGIDREALTRDLALLLRVDEDEGGLPA